MKWWKRGRRGVNPPEPHRPSEATRARMKAEQALRETKAKTPMYRDLGEQLRQIREENNFAAAFVTSIREGRR